MSKAELVLAKAAAEIGYYAPDDPEPGSKYGRWEAEKLDQPWLAGPSTKIWWCMIFVSWCFDGICEVPGLPGYNTDNVLGINRNAGALVPVEEAQPGDIIIYDWDKSTKATNHTGILEVNYPGLRAVQAIEGNTSGTDGAHQSDGNGVWRRTRSYDTVAGVIRPFWNDPVVPVDNPVSTVPVVAPAPAPIPQPEKKYNMDRLDFTNAHNVPVRGRHVDNLQGLLLAAGYGPDGLVASNGRPDGIGGDKTKAYVAAAQVKFNTGDGNGHADLIVGDGTWKALIEY